MKILLLTEFFPNSANDITGGVESRAWYLTKHLSKKNEVIVISSRQKGMPEKKKLGSLTILRTKSVYPYSNNGNFVKRLKHQFEALNLVKDLEFDQVHGMSFLHYNTAWLISKLKKKPCSITYHECWIGEWNTLKPGLIGLMGEINERISAKLDYDKIISVSNTTKKQLKKRTGKNSIVIPNGIELEEFTQTNKEKEGILVACRLVKSKNVDEVLEAAKNLKTRITIIGEGAEKKSLQTIAKKNKLDCKFIGRVDRKRLLQELSKAKVYVNASTLEGFGIGLIEAAAAGTPYVCSNIAAFTEVSKKGKGGYLFKAHDIKDLEKKLSVALSNNADIESLKELVIPYDWRVLSEQFNEVLVDILSKS